MNIKSEKGAITLIALVTMLFLISFLMSMYIRLSNKAQSSIDATKEIAAQYARAGQDVIVAEDSQVIPIKTVEDLKLICSNKTKMIDGVVYKFSPDAYYAIQNDLDLSCDEENQWIPLPLYEDEEFTGVLDGLGHKITNIYIDANEDNQGLFGTLTGTVKNLVIDGGYIKGDHYVGGIAGSFDTGTIINCKNTATIVGKSNVVGGFFKTLGTNNIIDVWSQTEVVDENVVFMSGTKEATIPKGFKVSADVFEQTIEDGMVIQDSEGNEFVWVPVNYTASGSVDANGLDSGFLSVFHRSEWSDNERTTDLSYSLSYIEPNPDLGTWATDEYYDMMKSVQQYRGFYIGRYEAGSTQIRTETSGTTEVVVKRGAYPYNYVTWASEITDYTVPDENVGYGAIYLSKNMYNDDNKYGVRSTLCYGVELDSVFDFVKDDEHDVTDTLNWGNYGRHEFIITQGSFSEDLGVTFTKVNNIYQKGRKKVLLTTGASETNKSRNIYDIAGNLVELSMETDTSTEPYIYDIYSFINRI